jgi:hypothetical protein
LDNDVTLDFGRAEGSLLIEHYAFLVSEAEFDANFDRIQQRGLTYWADPSHSRANEINRFSGALIEPTLDQQWLVKQLCPRSTWMPW